MKRQDTQSDASDGRPASPRETGPRRFQQERARETHEKLLAAAVACFAEAGFDQTQSTDIARAAGVSVGTFYRYFTDKRQAFLEMIDDFQDRHSKRLYTEPASLPEIADRFFDYLRAHADIHRTFTAMSLRDEDVAAMRLRHEQEGRRGLAALIEEHIPRSRIPDPLAAATVIDIAIEAMGQWAILGYTSPPQDVDVDALRDAWSDMVHRYVFGELPGEGTYSASSRKTGD
jgi:AcrR family transcriptional regulator